MTPRYVRDAEVDWGLAAAIAGQAEAIVTGDGDLLELGAYEGVAILRVDLVHLGDQPGPARRTPTPGRRVVCVVEVGSGSSG